MDFEKVKIEITWSGNNIGCRMTEDGKNIEWQNTTRQERIKILNSFADMYNFFERLLK